MSKETPTLSLGKFISRFGKILRNESIHGFSTLHRFGPRIWVVIPLGPLNIPLPREHHGRRHP